MWIGTDTLKLIGRIPQAAQISVIPLKLLQQSQYVEAGDLAHSLCCSPERPSVFNSIRNQKESLYNLLSITETND